MPPWVWSVFKSPGKIGLNHKYWGTSLPFKSHFFRRFFKIHIDAQPVSINNLLTIGTRLHQAKSKYCIRGERKGGKGGVLPVIRYRGAHPI